MHSDELIITADTIVWLDGLVMGKPEDEEDARRMLRCLSGKTHQVITGVCLTTTEFQKSFATVTDVTFAELTEEEIDYYVQKYKPMDKAGSMAFRNGLVLWEWKALQVVYFNVMGLPIQRLYKELKKL